MWKKITFEIEAGQDDWTRPGAVHVVQPGELNDEGDFRRELEPDEVAKRLLREPAPEDSHAASVVVCPGQRHDGDMVRNAHVTCNQCGAQAFLGHREQSKYDKEVGAPIPIQIGAWARYHHQEADENGNVPTISTGKNASQPTWMSNINHFFRAGFNVPSRSHLRQSDSYWYDGNGFYKGDSGEEVATTSWLDTLRGSFRRTLGHQLSSDYLQEWPKADNPIGNNCDQKWRPGQ